MSSIVRQIVIAATAAALVAGSGGAQLLPPVNIPPVNLPPVNLPGGNLPVVGTVTQDVLRQPAARRVISPTLDSVAGLPESIAEAGAPTLLELRRLRLQELI